MNIKTRFAVSVLVVAVIGFCSESQSGTIDACSSKRDSNPALLGPGYASGFRGTETAQAGRRNARPGDIASGAVLNAPAGELHLNIRPCEGDAFVVVFHQPYSRSTRGQKSCAGQTVTIEQVQQN